MAISEWANSFKLAISARFCITSPRHDLVKGPKLLIAVWLSTCATLFFAHCGLDHCRHYSVEIVAVRCFLHCIVYCCEFILLCSRFLSRYKHLPTDGSCFTFLFVCFCLFCAHRILFTTPPDKAATAEGCLVFAFTARHRFRFQATVLELELLLKGDFSRGVLRETGPTPTNLYLSTNIGSST